MSCNSFGKNNAVAKIKDNEIHKYTTLLFIPLKSKRNKTLNNVDFNRFDNKLIRLVSSKTITVKNGSYNSNNTSSNNYIATKASLWNVY